MRRVIPMAVLAILAGGLTAWAIPPGAELGGNGKAGGAVGKKWGFEVIQNKKPLKEDILRFHDRKVFYGEGGKEIGSYRPVGNDKYEIDITDGKLKGKHTVNLTVNPPTPVWSGETQMPGLAAGNVYFRLKPIK